MLMVGNARNKIDLCFAAHYGLGGVHVQHSLGCGICSHFVLSKNLELLLHGEAVISLQQPPRARVNACVIPKW